MAWDGRKGEPTMLNLPKRIYIKEVGPRDGLQIEKTFVPTATKIEMIDRLSQCGFADIQSAAFVHPKAVPNMADAEEVLAEIAKVFTAVNTDGMAPIEYFAEDVQAAVAALLPEGFDLKTLELNEFVTVDQSGYTDAIGDVTAYFEFATPYALGQKLVMLLGFYSGEKDAQDNYEVEWVALAAEVQEDGLVAVTIPAECMVKMQTSKAVAAAVLSEPVAE